MELVAQKPREFGIEVNTDLETILQSSVLTAGAEGIIRGLACPYPKMSIESVTTCKNVVVNLPPDEEARSCKEDKDKHEGEDKYEDNNEEKNSADKDNIEEDTQEDQTSVSSENNNQSDDKRSM